MDQEIVIFHNMKMKVYLALRKKNAKETAKHDRKENNTTMPGVLRFSFSNKKIAAVNRLRLI